jgi:alkylation response protein AidB-like acyl-CoA dehydrogenase
MARRFLLNRYLLYRCELVFENCFVPQENVLGEEGKGIISCMS